jgi:hypothetical protein
MRVRGLADGEYGCAIFSQNLEGCNTWFKHVLQKEITKLKLFVSSNSALKTLVYVSFSPICLFQFQLLDFFLLVYRHYLSPKDVHRNVKIDSVA